MTRLTVYHSAAPWDGAPEFDLRADVDLDTWREHTEIEDIQYEAGPDNWAPFDRKDSLQQRIKAALISALDDDPAFHEQVITKAMEAGVRWRAA